MPETLVDFTAPGSVGALSHSIEDYAQQRRIVSALVVPWESTDAAVTMAVTSVSGEGWALEHTNLGTIQLTDLGESRTRIAISRATIDHEDEAKLAAMLARFAGQLRETLELPSDATA